MSNPTNFTNSNSNNKICNQITVNPGKNECICIEKQNYHRFCIKTPVITDADDILAVAQKYGAPHMQPNDALFITEKAVACTQKRAIPMKEIHPSFLANLLSRFVHKTPCGIGLSIPQTMEMALQECGVIRILFATVCSGFCKLIGVKGVFYRTAGEKASAIDGPCSYTLPPYNEYVVLGPNNPNQVAKEVSLSIGHPVLITDINDLGGNILGKYPTDLDSALYVKILQDNPLGQTNEQTLMGIIRLQGEATASFAF